MRFCVNQLIGDAGSSARLRKARRECRVSARRGVRNERQRFETGCYDSCLGIERE